MPILQVYKTLNDAFLLTLGGSYHCLNLLLELLVGRVLVSFILVSKADPAHKGVQGYKGRGTLVFAWVGRSAGGDAAASRLPLLFYISGG